MKFRKALILSFFLVVAMAHGQSDNMVHVKSFPGNDVGTKVSHAMASCPSAGAPCILVIDASLAGFPAGTMPTLCANCSLADYRTGAIGVPGLSSNGANGITVSGIVSAATTVPLSIRAEGDSLTYGWEGSFNVGSWPAALAGLIPAQVYNSAVGGFTSSQVCALDGACPTYTTAQATIPACASLPCASGVDVTYTSGYEPVSSAFAYNNVYGFSNQPNGVNETLDGIAGNVVYDGAHYVFTPSQICSSTVVPSGTQHIISQPYYSSIKIVNAGKNDGYSNALTEANIALIVANRPAGSFFGVMSVINSEEPSENKSGSGYSSLSALWSNLSSTYGSNWVSYGGVDTREVLVNYACAATDPVSEGDCATDEPSAYLRAVDGEGTLASSITNSQTSFTVTLSNSATCCTGNLILIDGGTSSAELDQVASGSCTGSSCSITVTQRGYQGSAVSHNSGAAAIFIDQTHLNETGYALQAQIVAEWLGAKDIVLPNSGAVLSSLQNKGVVYTANSAVPQFPIPTANYLQPGTQQRTTNNLAQTPLWNFTEAFPVQGGFGDPPGTPFNVYSPAYPNAPATTGLNSADQCVGNWTANGVGSEYTAGAVCFNSAENNYLGQWNFYASTNKLFGAESWGLVKSISAANETMPTTYTVPAGGTVYAPATATGNTDTLATTSQITHAPAPSPTGTPACVQGTGTTLTINYSPTAGDAVFIAYYNSNGVAPSSFVDNLSDAIPFVATVSSSPYYPAAYLVLSSPSGVTSYTATQAAGFNQICVSEYKGVSASGTVATGLKAGSSYTISAVTQAQNSYLVAALDADQTGSFTASTGTIRAQGVWWTSNGSGAIQDISAATAGSNSISGSSTGANYIRYVAVELQSGIAAQTATQISTSGTANQVWGMNSGATAQGWQTRLTGSGTLGYIPAWTGTTSFGNSHMDDGVTTANTVTSTEPLHVTGQPTNCVQLPCIAGSVTQTGLNAASNGTLVSSPTLGMYKVNFVMQLTATGTAGTINGYVTCTGPQGTVSTSLFVGLTVTSANEQSQANYTMVCTSSANMTWTTSFSSVTGSPVYSVYVTAERLQ